MSASGANTAERGPTHTRASPAAQPQPLLVALALAEARSGAPPRCRRSAPGSGPTVCGVSAISGTSTIAPRPAASVACTAWRYTSVLPEPVTPCSRNRPAAASPARAASAASTASSARALLAGQRRDPVEPAPDRHRRRPGARPSWPSATRPRASSRRSVAVPSAVASAGPSLLERGRAPPAGGRSGRSSPPAPAPRASVSAATSTRLGAGPRRRRRAGARATAPAPGSSSTARRSSRPARPGRPGRRAAAPRRARPGARARAPTRWRARARPRAWSGGRTGRAAGRRPRHRPARGAAGSRTGHGRPGCG